MADSTTDNPLLKALPPETDYLSYLTILEYNLTHEQLPTLHTVLQDEILTANIGWDLVHLLLPLLPASQQCLQDVSRLGNPREVVLKVTELLEGIGREDDLGLVEDSDHDGIEQEEGDKTRAKKLEELKQEDITVVDHGENTEAGPAEATGSLRPPSKALRFTALVDMLSILHPRIKTKYPSRFLSTALQAILPAYMQVASRSEATEAVLGFIKDLSGTQRPKLPPRKSSSAVTTQPLPRSAPDPESQGESIGADEAKLQSRLLQSFLTYVTEGYMTSLVADEDVPGMAWSCRYQEKLHPEKMVPRRRSYTDLFSQEESLHERDATTGHILALVRDLKLTVEELLLIVTKPDDAEADEMEELPSTASDVPLSRTGSLYLLAIMAASSVFFDAPASLPPRLRVIPDFAAMLSSSLGNASSGSTGGEPESLIDAVLSLGFYILNDKPRNEIATSAEQNDGIYNNILQRLSLLSANLPSPALRYNAHLLTSSILHFHPSDHFRLAFIRDTLEHCPFENLKASAVGWLKDELLRVNREKATAQHGDLSNSIPIFTTPAALVTLSPFLFPNVNDILRGQTTATDTYTIFQAYQPFFLAILNLLYLLLSSPVLSERLGLKESSNVISREGFLQPLLDTSRGLRTSILSDEVAGFSGTAAGEDEGKNAALAALELLDMSVQQVENVFELRESS